MTRTIKRFTKKRIQRGYRPAVQIDETFMIPVRDPNDPLTPEEIKTKEDVARVFRESMEKDGRGAKLKAKIDAALEESYRVEREHKEYWAKCAEERKERQAKENMWGCLAVIFFPITILWLIIITIGLTWEHWQDDKATKIRLEEERQRLKDLGYRDDEIITFNG